MLKKLLVLVAVLIFSTASFCGTPPKNVILLIGDGMGMDYTSVAIHSFEDSQFRLFSVTGIVVTCSADKLITDSAAGATAYSTGERTYNGGISVDGKQNKLKTVVEYAEENGYKTGLVATSSITHATPAAFYAHVENRGMENEIAEFMVNSGVDVAIGAGTRFFLPDGKGGKREDNKNVVELLKQKGYEYYDSAESLLSSNTKSPVISLLNDKALDKGCDRDYTLGQLTEYSINKLNANNEKGFFLMVEGSQIDWAGHANDEDYAIGELKDFNTALKAALDFAKKDGNTLVVVTADHETGGMSIVEGEKDGSDIDLAFNTDHHTATCVPLFAFGPDAENFTGVMDNKEVGKKLISFFTK